MSKSKRTAIVGGDGRQRRRRRWQHYDPVIFFQGGRSGGNGELARLEAALRAGSIDQVILLARWNGHSVTTRVRRVCRALGIPVRLLP